MKEELETASAEEKRLHSDLIRSALKHYIRTNPDGIEVFARKEVATKQPKRDREFESTNTPVNGIYDPSKEL